MMSPVLVFGLVLAAAGFLVSAVPSILVDRAVRSRMARKPDLDVAGFRRRNMTMVRIVGGLWLVGGVGLAVYGLAAAG